ncbi:MAG: class II glutamine amidotransferase [Alphaproteobacteria bacterium]|nr:class II glutamine amidotransferase [Alphaproteobacteria bacterium]
MCRWIAYTGPRLSPATLLFGPTNSLIRQSLSARRSIVPTNGDGFGLGWYGDVEEPGLFRDTLPAWNDQNLQSLSRQIRSKLFFAHVRASTGTATSRDNCHPFRYRDRLFMHNGRIGGYAKVRRELEHLIPAELYAHRSGTTDSEAFFLLALGFGLTDDPAGALARAVGTIERVMAAHRIEEPLRIAAAYSEGERIIALRYSSDRQSPTMFFGRGGDVYLRDGEIHFGPGNGSVIVLSEPLDGTDASWNEVPESTWLIAERGQVQAQPFRPVTT